MGQYGKSPYLRNYFTGVKYVITKAVPVLGIMLVAPCWSAETTLTVGYAVEYNDNATRTSIPQSDIIKTYLLGVTYRDVTPVLVLDISGNVVYRDYTKDTYIDDLRAVADVTAVWNISPERFRWHFQDRLRPIAIDTSQPLTPNNLDTINIFTTGPDLNIRLGSTDSLEFEARHSNTTYQELTYLDNQRDMGLVRWRHRISSLTALSANGEITQLDYEATPVSDDVTYQNIFLRLESTRRRMIYTVDFGVTKIEQNSLEDTEATLARFVLSYRPTRNSTIEVLANHEISDPSREVLTSTPGGGTDPGALVSDLFVSNHVAVTYRRGVESDYLQFGVYGRERFYLQTNGDEVGYGANGEIGMHLGGRWRAILFGEYRYREYPLQASLSHQDYELGIRSRLRLRRRLELTVEVARRSRRSSDPSQSYDEHRGIIGLLYTSRNRSTNPTRSTDTNRRTGTNRRTNATGSTNTTRQ